MTQFFQSSRKIPVCMTEIFYCERHKSRFLGVLVVYRNWCMISRYFCIRCHMIFLSVNDSREKNCFTVCSFKLSNLYQRENVHESWVSLGVFQIIQFIQDDEVRWSWKNKRKEKEKKKKPRKRQTNKKRKTNTRKAIGYDSFVRHIPLLSVLKVWEWSQTYPSENVQKRLPFSLLLHLLNKNLYDNYFLYDGLILF